MRNRRVTAKHLSIGALFGLPHRQTSAEYSTIAKWLNLSLLAYDARTTFMALSQLIYVSSATRPLTGDDIRTLLESSVRHNSTNDVTGMLLYASGSFLQVLEGDEAAIDEVFTRISADDRHHNIVVIARERVAARDFGSWSMGFRGVNVDDGKALRGYAPLFEHGFDAAAIGAKPGLALDLLKDFAANNR
jgi:hypothetical protein